MTARNLPAANLAISTFPEILESLGIRRIARTSGWQLRSPRKVDAAGLVLAFCSLVFGGEVCHLSLAMHLGVSKCQRVSRQAIWKRVNGAFVTMLLDLICQAMIRQMEMASSFATDPVFAHFAAVLIQDGTCIPMPQSLVGHYPGNANRTGRKAVAKLDVLLDIKRWALRRLRLNPYNRSDQSEALEANEDIEPGWLVMRDLGYYSIKAIAGIIGAGAFFLSRLKFGTTLYDPATLKPINLEALLKRKRKLDIPVLLGNSGAQVRLIAEPLPPDKAKRRREKALQDRDRRIKHGANYMLRLGWTLLITNVKPSVWTPKQACKAYEFRWQVETMFKSWKSHIKLAAQPTKSNVESPHKAEAIILAQMLMVVTVLMPLTAAQIACRNERKGQPVPSQIKIAILIPLYVKATKEQVKWILQNIQYCCAHESRNRKSAASASAGLIFSSTNRLCRHVPQATEPQPLDLRNVRTAVIFRNIFANFPTFATASGHGGARLPPEGGDQGAGMRLETMAHGVQDGIESARLVALLDIGDGDYIGTFGKCSRSR